MNQLGSHPSDLQIEQYVAELFGDDLAPQSEEMEAHFAECDSCQARRLEAERIQLGILKCPAAKTPYAECPDQEVLEEYAAGLCSPKTALQIRAHVARCDFCAPLLKEFLEDFSGDLPVHAKDVLDQLPASKPEWRQKFVRERIIPRPGFFSRVASRVKSILAHFTAWPFWSKVIPAGGFAYAVLAATGLGSVVFVSMVTVPWAVNKYQLHHAEVLAAAAYEELRPSEMRLTGVPHAEFNVERSKAPVQISILHRPSLAAALNAVDKKRNSLDPRWIRVRGRIALLLRDNEAIDWLARAKDSGLNDSGTEIDLAAAYFQRDTSNGQKPPDLGNTINILIQVLKNPRLTREQKATALFDLAIAYEKMLVWNQAVPTWEEYLKIDPDSASPWHKEAQEHLDYARTQMGLSKQRGWRDPAFFLSHASDPKVQNSIEEYQDIALREWLPKPMADANSVALEASHTLADLLAGQQHADPWLKDFLKALQPDDQPGLQALGEAIERNRRGLHTSASKEAQDASAIFARRGNKPGNLRARFEFVYANQRLLEEQRCLDSARKLAKDLQNTRYSWLQVQIALEQSTCLHFEGEGKSDESQRQLGLARQLAETSHFPILSLRALTFDAAINNSGLKESRQCWDQIATPLGQGLEQYWAAPTSPLRLYELYWLIRKCFSQRQLWYAAEAMQRSMIAILENEIDLEDKNVVLEVTAHQTLGQILKEQQEESAAEAETRRAISLLSKVPDEPIIRKYELPIKLEMADLQLDREETDAALTTLNEIADLAESIQDNLIRLNFYRVRGDAYRKNHQLTDAELDYEKGIEIAESSLKHLTGEDRRLQWTNEIGEIYRGLVAVFLEKKDDQEALQLWEWYQARSLAQKTNVEQEEAGNSWSKIEATILQEPLPDASDSRLVYATTRDHVYIWMIGRSGIKTVSIPEKREGLEQRIRQYLQKCSNRISNPAALEQESRKLFLLLLQPVIADLQNTDTVTIDLDQSMNGLVLETLKSPEGWYFGQKYLVIQSPGFIKEKELRQQVQKDYESGLIVDSGDLPRSEHDAIVAFFPSITSRNGSDTTAAELPTLLDDSELFIFIGHGESGTLMMSDSQPLTQHNFPPQSLRNLRLAVLAACSTGVAEYGLLDTNSLVHAFLAGETSSVVASQWDVDSEATTDLMKVFFRELKKGKSVARSLFEARQEVFRNHSHPYYWGAFSVTGRAD